jgi:TrmH family RNA methyltransferase
MITSAQNPKIKLARSLAGRSKERREAEAFLAEGVRLIEEALASDWPFRFVLHSTEPSERAAQLVQRIKDRGVETEEITDRLLESLSDTETSQGILAVLADAQPQPARELGVVLIADAVRDPGNLGTLLRTAEAAGVDAVFLAPGTTDAFAPKVVRAGMGAHFRLPIYEINWEEIRTQVAAYKWNVYLADMEGRSCWETDFCPPLALIIGGEAEGATEAARKLATQSVSIPMQGRAESLNAAVAGSILMFEVMRQVHSDTKDTKQH